MGCGWNPKQVVRTGLGSQPLLAPPVDTGIASRLAHLSQVGLARPLRRKPLLEFGQGSGIVLHPGNYYMLRSVQSSGYPLSAILWYGYRSRIMGIAATQNSRGLSLVGG